MLDDHRNACRERADSIPGWKSLSKNELCNRYVATQDENLKNAYLAAILYRYWNLIPKFYQMSSNVAKPEDCYDWLVESVLCAVNCKRWTEEDSSIYRDPNGPDKVINRAMKCARLNFYQFINRKKRKDNFGIMSFDELRENLHDNSLDIEDPDAQVEDSVSLSLKDFIRDVFNRKEYFQAFLLDCILTENVFDKAQERITLNEKHLVKVLRELDHDYAFKFARMYNIKLEAVEKALEYCQGMSSTKIMSKIEYNVQKLKHDSQLLEVLFC